jgi:uncharacterized protein YeaO (DUF488 family)
MGAVAASFDVRVTRVYDPPAPADGVRVLVDRLWPRGLAKARASLDDWCKQIAPSLELRYWYAHDPDLFVQFSAMYRAELEEAERAAALANLKEISRHRTITLLTATKDLELSHATVLAGVIPELD